MLPVGEQLHLQAVPQAEVTFDKQSEASAVEKKESAAKTLVESMVTWTKALAGREGDDKGIYYIML